jgi:hypothetical protein
MLALPEFTMTGRDRFELVGACLVLGELAHAGFKRLSHGMAHVPAKRLAHQFGAGAMLGPAYALKLPRHLGRE